MQDITSPGYMPRTIGTEHCTQNFNRHHVALHMHQMNTYRESMTRTKITPTFLPCHLGLQLPNSTMK